MIISKVFSYPDVKWVEKEIEVRRGFFTPKTVKEKTTERVEKSLRQVRKEFTEFVNSLPPENIISICECPSVRWFCGPEYHHDFVVWYKEDKT